MARESEPDILQIERAAFAAWPAEQVEMVGGWRARYSGGVTRRANSVWTLDAVEPAAIPQGELVRLIEQVEHFYRERGAPPMFQTALAGAPPSRASAELDAALARRGYRVDAPVAVMTCSPRGALAPDSSRPEPSGQGERARARGGGFEVVVERSVTEPWFDLSGRKGRYASVQGAYRALLDRIGPSARYALAREAATGEPVAVGLGVATGSLFGISSMMTLPEHRGRGAATAVLVALAEVAAREAMRALYLQVERANQKAISLYRKIGFVERYGYHYRVARG